MPMRKSTKKKSKKMHFSSADIDPFLKRLVRWAKQHEEILSVALIGSYARAQATRDSDIDIMLISKHPEVFISSQAWLGDFGTVQQAVQQVHGEVTSWHVEYEGHIKIEFAISSPTLVVLPVDAGTQKVMADGIEVLYDPSELLKNLLSCLE